MLPDMFRQLLKNNITYEQNWKKMTDLANFKFCLQKRKSIDHKYNKGFGFIDWNNTDEIYLLIKPAKVKFLKNRSLIRND